MSKIILKHSRIEIPDYNLGDNQGLERRFMVYSNVNHCYFMSGMEYNNESKTLIIPRGVNIHALENIIKRPIMIDDSHDPVDTVEKSKFKFVPRDEVQVKAIQFMTGQGSYIQNKNKSQLFLNLPTGKGKTFCTIYSIAIIQSRAMIIATTTEWLKQWKNFILQYTDISPSDVYIMTGEPAIRKLYRNGMGPIKYILATHATIRSYAAKYGWKEITRLFKFMKIGVKVFDEAHLDFDNICSIDFHTDTRLTIYVTATDKRSDKGQNIIYQRYFEEVPNINLFNKNVDRHTKYLAIKYDSCPTDKEIIRCSSNPIYGFDRNNYTNYIVTKPNYYMMLMVVLRIILHRGGKALIYIGTNDAITVTYNWIRETMPWLINSVGIYTSIVSPEQKPIELSKKIILSTTKSAGAATDIKELKTTVVLAEPFKSQVLAKQTLGRTRDSDTIYIECVDIGFASTNRYYNAKKQIFEKYALSPAEALLTNDELFIRAQQFTTEYGINPTPNICYNPISIIGDGNI